MGKVRLLLATANRRHWLGILSLLATSVFTVSIGGGDNYLSSVSSTVKQDPFDGTVMPIQKVPDWSNLSSGQNALIYSELPSSKFLALPEYDNDVLTVPLEGLSWSDKDKKIRNAQITYSVPYAGNYELNSCGEDCGSHPAVDIKTLKDTPIYAIANGVVETASSSGSWGNYVVIRHSGVPNPDSPSQTTTLFSTYAHLDQIFVSEGSKINKGEILGEVGDTGTATTFHLHFQIDNDSAPWHPYWPFTSAQASAAGYDFWDAVNYGVGQDNLYAYTENPMEFVQEHLDSEATFDDEPEVKPDEEDEVQEEDPEEPKEEEPQAAPEQIQGEDFSRLLIQVPSLIEVGEQETVHLYLLDEEGEVVEDDATFEGTVNVSLSDSSVASLNRSSLDRYAFDDGEATVKVYGDRKGKVSVSAHFGGISVDSSDIELLAEEGDFDHFSIVHDGTFVPGKNEIIQVQALDKDGNRVVNFEEYGTIEISLLQGDGTLEPDQVRNEDFDRGVAEIRFVGKSSESVILQFKHGLKTGVSEVLTARLFNDFSEDDDFYEAVNYLYRQGTIQGYPDGTFQASRTVSRVEALKFIFSGLEEPVSSKLKVTFSDTQKGEWYYPYLATAHSLGVVEGYSDGSFKPTQGVNRVEFLKMLFNVLDVNVDPAVVENPYEDVNKLSWYAPYVAYAKEKNIFPLEGSTFEPAEPMSRAEVAEVIYRFITVLDNGENAYSPLNKPSDY
ncbi:S-layer homology domain-containing protein [Candidatus Peregrinibacteria bacterium]|nr:MAG: S-layer homology domain-containing protein [Candidatus Peregrinibacteria bacterium]